MYLPDGRSNLVLHLRKRERGWQAKTPAILSLILDAVDAIIGFLGQ